MKAKRKTLWMGVDRDGKLSVSDKRMRFVNGRWMFAARNNLECYGKVDWICYGDWDLPVVGKLMKLVQRPNGRYRPEQ